MSSVSRQLASRIHFWCILIGSVSIGLAVYAFRHSSEMASMGSMAAQAGDSSRQRIANLTRAPAVRQLVAKAPAAFTPPQSPQPAENPQSLRVIARVDPALQSAMPYVYPPDEPGAEFDDWAGFEPWRPARPGTYRTVCVRLCDGAFFPVSFATTRNRLKQDAARCEAGCGVPARLFVSPPDGTAEDLVDVSGRPYAELPNAFRFRTSFDPACSCNGQPWEQQAIRRHQQLAAMAAAPSSVAVTVVETTAGPHLAQAPVDEPHRTRDVVVERQDVATLDRSLSGKDATMATSPEVQTRAVPEPVAKRAAKPAKQVALAAQTSKDAEDVKSAPSKVAAPLVPPAKKAPRAAPVAAPPAEKIVPVVRSASRVAPRPAAAPITRFVAVQRPSVTRGLMARADGASKAQRSFKSNDFWRLSYWETSAR
jgi:Protein of unknown function (DUF2865)